MRLNGAAKECVELEQSLTLDPINTIGSLSSKMGEATSSSSPAVTFEQIQETSSPSSSAASSSSTSRPSLSRNNSHNSSTSELDGIDLTSRQSSNSNPFGNPLSDLLETFFEPHLDLTQRRWNEFSFSVKRKAKLRRDEILKNVRSKARARNANSATTSLDWDGQQDGERDALRKAMEIEVRKMRKKVSSRRR